MMRLAATAALAVTFVGCGSASGRIASETLGISARDAHTEARSVATVWSSSAQLRWVAGEGISASGVALRDEGSWTFHYSAPDQSQDLVVQVRSLETASEEQAHSSPPGIVIGENRLGSSWIDSRVAMGALMASAETSIAAPVSMLLVPTRPEQWIARSAESGDRWHVNAETGEVIRP